MYRTPIECIDFRTIVPLHNLHILPYFLYNKPLHQKYISVDKYRSIMRSYKGLNQSLV